MDERQLVDIVFQALGEAHDDREDHRGRADHRGADQHRLGGGLEGVAGTVVFFQVALRVIPFDIEAEVTPDFVLNARDLVDGRQFVDALRIVGHWTIRIDSDRHRAHTQEAEGDQPEGEDRRRQHQGAQSQRADEERPGHQAENRGTEPERREVARHQAGQNIQGRPALLGADDDLPDVAALDGGERLHQFRDQRAGKGAERDDRAQFPPHAVAQVRDHREAGEIGQDDRNDAGEPDQLGQRGFEVHLLGVFVARLGDRRIDRV